MGDGARAAAKYFGRVRKFPDKNSAVLKSVSVPDGDAGSSPSAKAMRIIARTRLWLSEDGHRVIAITGASIDAHTRNTARPTATAHGSGNAPGDGRRLQPCLQKWTRHRRFRLCDQVLTCWSQRRPRSLQKWTRGWWKSF